MPSSVADSRRETHCCGRPRHRVRPVRVSKKTENWRPAVARSGSVRRPATTRTENWRPAVAKSGAVWRPVTTKGVLKKGAAFVTETTSKAILCRSVEYLKKRKRAYLGQGHARPLWARGEAPGGASYTGGTIQGDPESYPGRHFKSERGARIRTTADSIFSSPVTIANFRK